MFGFGLEESPLDFVFLQTKSGSKSAPGLILPEHPRFGVRLVNGSSLEPSVLLKETGSQ